MYNDKPKYSAYGEIVRPAAFQSANTKVAVIPPNLKLFTNTRTINMNEITEEKEKNTYEILLKKGQIPFSILNERNAKVKIKYCNIYKTKKVKFDSLLFSKSNKILGKTESYFLDDKVEVENKNIYNHGKSKRIWNELYKVLDSSDVIVHVLDARYPKIFISKQVIEYMKKNEHKNLIFVLNKVDLIPTNIKKKKN